MRRILNPKISLMMLIACFMSYMVTTTVKMCVPTVISAMVSESFLDKSQSGLLAGIFYLVYGVGQLIFGKYFNNHAPYIGIKIALIGSAVCCVLMSLTKNFYLLLLIWSVCAFANSCFFPALMRIVSFMLKSSHSIWANRYLSIAYQAGTVLCLVAGSFIIKYIGWNRLYYFAAIISVLCIVYWFIAEYAVKASADESHYIAIGFTEANEEKTKIPIKSYIGTGVFCIFGISFFNSLITGVKSWAPTIIMETYNTTPSFSVLLNVVIVVANILFLLVIGRFVPKNKVKSVLVFYIIILPVTVILNFTDILNEYSYALLLGAFTSIVTYASNVATIQVPYYFYSYNDVSRVSGIANMSASFGVLGGNYFYGILADNFGWQIIMILGCVFTGINIMLAAFAVPKFNRFVRDGLPKK